MRCALAACLVLLWTSLTAPVAVAEEGTSLAQIAAQLAQPPVLRADFEQERKLRLLTRPLVSQGRLLFVSEQGVLWQVTAPQPAVLVVKPDEVIEFTDGKASPMAFGESPLFQTLVQVFLAALSGKLDGLSETFDLAPASAEQGWRLGLTPKSADLTEIITSIELGGQAFVEDILIAEASGDSTLIRFSGFQTEPAALDDQEKAYLAD